MKKALFVSILVVAIAVYGIANGVERQRYECKGSFTEKNQQKEGSIFFVLETYKWWILWAESKGNLKTEIPNIHFAYYPDVRKVGVLFHIYQDSRMQGAFSTLSRSFSLQTVAGFFDGTCEAISDGR
jgi:hypothetical protein